MDALDSLRPLLLAAAHGELHLTNCAPLYHAVRAEPGALAWEEESADHLDRTFGASVQIGGVRVLATMRRRATREEIAESYERALAKVLADDDPPVNYIREQEIKDTARGVR